MKTLSIILLLLLSCGVFADPNSLPDPNTPPYILWYPDSNDINMVYIRIDKLVVTAPKKYRYYGAIQFFNKKESLPFLLSHWCLKAEGEPSFNLHDFAAFSAYWKPTEILDNTLGIICYTVGGKRHYYSNCRYIKDRNWTNCLCNDLLDRDGTNICLTCIARKLIGSEVKE